MRSDGAERKLQADSLLHVSVPALSFGLYTYVRCALNIQLASRYSPPRF
jgi:hypothetical protein